MVAPLMTLARSYPLTLAYLLTLAVVIVWLRW